MSSILNNGYAGIPVEEAVPESVEVRGVSKSSLLTARKRIRFQAQTGTTATPGQIVQFVLSDSASLLDLNSAVLSFTATTTGTGATALDDGPAWLRRFQVSIGGSLVEDVDNAHRHANMCVYSSADKAWYQGPGSFAGYWALNPDLASSTNAYVAYANNTAAGSMSAITGDVTTALTNASARYKAGMSVGVPLGLVSGLFRCKQYYPLCLSGEMVLQFTIASAAEALLQADGATNGNFSIRDMFLEVDLLTPHPSYQAILNRIAQNESEPGIVIPVETTITSQGVSIPSGAQDSSIVVSRATNNLRKVLVGLTPTTKLTDVNWPSVSCFGHQGFDQVQFRIGGNYFPSQPANSDARAFWMLQSAFGEPINGSGTVINWNLFKQTTKADGSNGEGSAWNAAQLKFADKHILGYSFDNYKNTSTPLDADGVSIAGASGAQLIVQLKNNPQDAVTPIVSILATKYIHLQGGALSVKGS